MNRKFNKKYRPDILFAFSENQSDITIFKDRYKKGETIIYVCQSNACKQPVKTITEAEEFLKRK